MIIVSTQNSSDWSQAQLYRFAGHDVLFQTPSVVLDRFLVSEAPIEMVVQASMAVQEYLDNDVSQKRMKKVYSGLAPFGDRERDITFLRRPHLGHLLFEDKLVCELDFSNNHIHLIREGGFTDMVNLELITGPAMMIMLARLKTYCLHASAVTTKAGVMMFIGESGVGKSTLAWHAGDGWRQLSDDISPILFDKQTRQARLSAEFPQLKLDMACANGLELGDVPIDCIYRISPEPGTSLQFRDLSKTEAMLQFVRHTVGAKLFDEKIMARHSKFATFMANKVPFVEVAYPRDLLQLTELREQIHEHLESISDARKSA